MDAARRQLETAIGLWFHDADFVAVHTLAMAAHEILRALNKKRGGEPKLGDAAAMIRREVRRQYAEAVLLAANFFKHGTKDPLAAYRFTQDTNDYVLLEVCQIFEILKGEETPLNATAGFLSRLPQAGSVQSGVHPFDKTRASFRGCGAAIEEALLWRVAVNRHLASLFKRLNGAESITMKYWEISRPFSE